MLAIIGSDTFHDYEEIFRCVQQWKMNNRVHIKTILVQHADIISESLQKYAEQNNVEIMNFDSDKKKTILENNMVIVYQPDYLIAFVHENDDIVYKCATNAHKMNIPTTIIFT